MKIPRVYVEHRKISCRSLLKPTHYFGDCNLQNASRRLSVTLKPFSSQRIKEASILGGAKA